jgi:tRNA threonylcarbamoyl adenosine modification protein TsaD
MHILSLETTCDETAAAIVTDRLEVLASVVASQDDLHRRFGGVVPEIASRAHLERILPVIDETLRRAGLSLADIDVVAVANTPGLAGSLLVGLVAAKTICVARQIPLVAVNHLQAHVYACRLAAGRDVFPCVGLIVSGGHTSLYRCSGPLDFTFLGGTIDDAAGEAFDKVAAMLGLLYPGGPSIERAAASGNPRAYAFPRSLLREDRLEFSFSGLKTAVRYAIEGKRGERRGARGEGGGRRGEGGKETPRVDRRSDNLKFEISGSEISDSGILSPGTHVSQSRESALRPPPSAFPPPTSPLPLPPSLVADLAASFQEAVVDCLVGKALAALDQTGIQTLCVGGGVAANARLRQRLAEECQQRQIKLHIAPMKLCTDNAVMGAIAVERWKAGLVESLDLDAVPGVLRSPQT